MGEEGRSSSDTVICTVGLLFRSCQPAIALRLLLLLLLLRIAVVGNQAMRFSWANKAKPSQAGLEVT